MEQPLGQLINSIILILQTIDTRTLSEYKTQFCKWDDPPPKNTLKLHFKISPLKNVSTSKPFPYILRQWVSLHLTNN